MTLTVLAGLLKSNQESAYKLIRYYHNNPKYWDRQAWVNSVDPDQMPQNAASDQGLHRLPLTTILDTLAGSKIDFFKF